MYSSIVLSIVTVGILHADKGIEMHHNMNIEIYCRIGLLKALYRF